MSESIESWIALLLVGVMLSSALVALISRSHLVAVVATSVLSLGLTLLFVLLRAPDVAMTEGVIGAGLGSLIMALALSRLGLWSPGRTPDGVRGGAEKSARQRAMESSDE